MSTLQRIVIGCCLCIAACLASLHAGQDSSYDFWNYHLYNAWAIANDRWSQDFFAAGAQGFFVPWLDVPYYLVASALFPSHGALVVALAGLPYGALLCVLCLIAGTLARTLELDGRDRVVFIVFAVVFAGTGAGAWSLVGTTSNDITIAAIVLAGMHSYLRGLADRDIDPSMRTVAVAGALGGLAVALKLTAAVPVLGLAVVVGAVASSWRSRITSLLAFGGAAALVFIAVYSPWGFRLYALTGNPFFPMFNGIFDSDWIVGETLRDDRFLPQTWSQWLFYPFHWITTGRVVTEVPLRDVRPAVWYVATAAFAAAAFRHRPLRERLRVGRGRVLLAIAIFIVVSYIAWLVQFSIFRYLVPTDAIAGMFALAVIVLALRELRGESKLPAFALALFVAATIAHAMTPQWRHAPVGADPFAVDTAPLEQGALVLFADQPMSFLAPGLAANSGGLRFMTIPRAFESQPELHAGAFTRELGRRIRARVDANTSVIYVLYNASSTPPLDDIASFDLVLDMKRCQPGRSPLGLDFVACRARRSEDTP